jgi:hypothetical protein
MSKKERDDLVEEQKTEKEQEAEMEVVHASKSEVVAKPKNVKKLADKAVASKLSEEEQRKAIEDNVLGEFNE